MRCRCRSANQRSVEAMFCLSTCTTSSDHGTVFRSLKSSMSWRTRLRCLGVSCSHVSCNVHCCGFFLRRSQAKKRLMRPPGVAHWVGNVDQYLAAATLARRAPQTGSSPPEAESSGFLGFLGPHSQSLARAKPIRRPHGQSRQNAEILRSANCASGSRLSIPCAQLSRIRLSMQATLC